MSQHWFPTTLGDGRRATVLAGYDRPLNACFLVIEVAGADEPVYSNLDDPMLALTGGMARDFDYLIQRLGDLGATFPATVAAAIREDIRERAGNRYVEYDEHGAEVLAAV